MPSFVCFVDRLGPCLRGPALSCCFWKSGGAFPKSVTANGPCLGRGVSNRESIPSDHWQHFHSTLCAGDAVSSAHLLCPSALKTKGIWEVFCDRKKHGEGGHGLAMWLQPSVFSRKALEGAGVL